LPVVVRALIKAAVGANADDLDVDTVLEQVYTRERADLSERLGRLLGAYPQLLSRVRSLVDFDAELFALDVEEWLAADGLR
jgi:hypothetical protein